MSVMVIACFKPKPGMTDALKAHLKTHLPTLRSEGLVGDSAVLCGEAPDGTIVEVFCWESMDAIEVAHKNDAVLANWAIFEEICDYVAIGDVAGADSLFTPLTPIDLQGEP